MTPEREQVITDLDSQLVTDPQLLHLSIKDYLTYEKMVQELGSTFLGVRLNDDSVVPLTYKTKPVIMRPNEVKEVVQELVRLNSPVPAVTPPVTSGPVKPMTKEERNLEEPAHKKMGNLISELTNQPATQTKPEASNWWQGDTITSEPVNANATQAS